MSLNCREYHDAQPKQAQRGAALIVAIVAVLLVALLATRVSSDFLVLIRGVENHSELQQARAYLLGTELIAEGALLRDLQLGTELDSMLELWARPLQLPLPEGILDACVLDLQSRLNLNDLGAPAAATFSSAQKRFIRLLQALDLDVPLDSVAAVALANAVFDWRDADSDPRYPGGAEELEYLRVEPPYRPANQAFASVAELKLVTGMTPELVAALTPHVGVWGNGSLNLNTLDHQLSWSAQSEASMSSAPAPILLRTLNNPDSLLPLSIGAANAVVSARSQRGGVVDSLDFFREGVLAGQNWDLDGLALASEYFLLQATMQVRARRYRMESVLHRTQTPGGVPMVRVETREFSNLATATDADCAAALPR